MSQYKKLHFWADLESMMAVLKIFQNFQHRIVLEVILLAEKKVRYRENQGWMVSRIKLLPSRL